MYMQTEHASVVEPNRSRSGGAQEIIDGMQGFVSPPDVYVRATGLLRAEAGARELAEVIQTDPNLTARLLGIVNSAFYGFRAPIETISRAIAVVGGRDLEALLTGACALQTFSNISNDLVNMDVFWRHSVFTATLASMLAKRYRVLHPERLFIAGLLHDIGALVVFNRLPDASGELLEMAQGSEQQLAELEQTRLGFNHGSLAALALSQWHLPFTLCDAIRYHHDAAAAADTSLEASMVYVADCLANRSGIGAMLESADRDVAIDPVIWASLGEPMDDAELDDLVGDAGLAFQDTVSMLGIG